MRPATCPPRMETRRHPPEFGDGDGFVPQTVRRDMQQSTIGWRRRTVRPDRPRGPALRSQALSLAVRRRDASD